jgi:hypothetical protein
MSEPTKHHYLPVFYLKRWADRDGKVVRYHRANGRIVVSRPSPKRTGYEEGLYTLKGTARPQEIETEFFKIVDNGAARMLERLIARGTADLTSDQRSVWGRFVNSLQLRSPHSVAEIKARHDGILRAIFESQDAEYQAKRQERDPDTAYEDVIRRAPDLMENAHKILLTQLIDDGETGNRIINMRWAVMNLSAARHTLLTVDRPYYTSSGYGDRNCLLSVPLSPTHLFVAANDIRQLRLLAAQSPMDTVCNANKMFVSLAVENVYGCTDTHLEFVEGRFRAADQPPVPGLITRD